MVEQLVLSHVTKKYGGVIAVRDFSFSVKEGEIVGLIGPNGAGKTTVFNIISGITKPDSGEVIFDGTRIDGYPPYKIVSMGISRTFQITRPLRRLTVIENVLAGILFASKIRSINEAREQAYGILKVLSLTDKANIPASLLTLPEQRRLEIARALSTNAKVLLLDEALAGLNSNEILSLLKILKEIKVKNNLSIVITEHIIKAILSFCNRIVVMADGAKIFDGKPEQVINHEKVVEAFMGVRDWSKWSISS